MTAALTAEAIALRSLRYADEFCEKLDQEGESPMVVLMFAAQMAARAIHKATDKPLARELTYGAIDAALRDLTEQDKAGPTLQ